MMHLTWKAQLWAHLDESVHVSGAGHTDELGRHILHPAPHCLQHLHTANDSFHKQHVGSTA